jgi:hypothetical protein
MLRTRNLLIVLAVVTAVAGGVAVAVVGLTARDAVSSPLTFRVDPALRPSVERVAGVDGGPPGERPVGALVEPDGRVAELVLDEVIVHVRDDQELDAFVQRWNGQVLDSFEADDDGGRDHLVRVDLGRADLASLPKDLAAVEP